ncbi:MAG: helix-turn-helix transcriptional regulator [Roseateles sp.]|uniref:helix-turn-helix transcriptional regulator n=1 Tax=Roseateles sp. TaxID=1971397 RepID=UPI0039ED19A0
MNAFAEAFATERAASLPASWGDTQHNRWFIVDQLPQAIMLVHEDRSMLSANPMARRLIDGGAIRINDGRLTALGQLGSLPLARLLAQAAAGAALDCAVWFERCLSTGLLHLSRSRHSQAGLSLPPPGSPVLLVVQIDQPALAQSARIDAIAQKYQLSATERHVLMLLADGMTVEGSARHLAVQLSTVRSHVRALLGKTQAPSLMQLLRWTGSAQALPH